MARGGAARGAARHRRSGAEQHKRGATHPPPDSERSERRGGGTGGRGQGARPTRGGETQQHDCGRSAPSNGRGEEISARARGASHRKASGTNNERRRAWRAGARATRQVAPRLWRVERTRGGTQRTLIRKAGAERRPQRVVSQARSGAERAAGWIEEDVNRLSILLPQLPRQRQMVVPLTDLPPQYLAGVLSVTVALRWGEH